MIKPLAKAGTAVVVLLALGVFVFAWGMGPTTKEFRDLEAQQRLKDLFQIEVMGPAQGLARFAWPGESTQYYRFTISDAAFQSLKNSSDYKEIRSCGIDDIPKLIDPPDWFRWPTDRDKPQMVASAKGFVWRALGDQTTYLFHSSVQHNCF